MPELPEVEAARRSIEHNCIGKKIKRSIIADDPKVIHGVSPSDFEASLLGKTIIAVHRKGKNMWLQLDSPPFPSFQFGMAGAMYINGVAITKYKRSAVNDTDEWPSKYSKLFIELDDGLELSFTDKRRFAKVRLLENPASVPPISELGPDALLEPMNIDEFIDCLSKKKIGIKALLLDQSFISGIGNWIADEVLYQAMIHPLQIVSILSKESCVALHECINKVIQYAVEVDADCSRFPIEWLFHFRWGKRPGQVNGKKIEFMVAGGRTTAYVSEVQKLNGSQAAKATNKPRNQTVKKCKDEESEDERNGPESEDEENARSVKSKEGRNTTSCRRKASSAAERKLNGSNKDNGSNSKDNDDDDDDDDDDRKKKTRTSKNPSTRRKSKKTTRRKKEIGRNKEASKDRQSQERDGGSGWQP